jgi:hypothetical protein
MVERLAWQLLRAFNTGGLRLGGVEAGCRLHQRVEAAA